MATSPNGRGRAMVTRQADGLYRVDMYRRARAGAAWEIGRPAETDIENLELAQYEGALWLGIQQG